jgi:hypothetical protein
LGTKNYARPPVAIVLGGGYTKGDLETMRFTCQQTEGAKIVVWLENDRKDLPSGPSSDYAKRVGQRVKDKLQELEAAGKFSQDIVVEY